MRFSKRRAIQSLPAISGEQPEVYVAGQVVIDTKQTPFSLFALAFLDVAFGTLLSIHSLYGLAAGRGDSLRVPILIVGGVEIIVGCALWLNARWAFRATRVLIPANFVAIVILFALNPSGLLLPVIAVYGFTVFVLYGPGTLASASQTRLRAWLRGPGEIRLAAARAGRMLERQAA
jgi:hypothetical protein